MQNNQTEQPQENTYYSSEFLQDRYQRGSRTIHRWQFKETNPLPEPTIRPSGTCNLWLAEEILAWEEREKELAKTTPRTIRRNTH